MRHAGKLGVADIKGIGLTRRASSVISLVAIVYCSVYVFCVLLPPPLGSADARWSEPLQSNPLAAMSALSTETERARPIIGKVSMLYGTPDPIYTRALASHEAHALQHGYPMYVLREPLIEGIWSKLVYLLAVVTAELSKPAAERLHWLFWFDADTYVLNPNVPLEVFLPPADDHAFRNISFMGGHDHRGLNAGVLMFRVDQTTLHLLSTALALPRYRPDLKLKFAEQTALQLILGDPPVLPMSPHAEDDAPDVFAWRAAIVPQRWFNAYLGERAWNGTRLEDLDGKPRKEKANSVKPGDLLVHFAGHSQQKRDRMTAMIDAAEQKSEVWVKPFEHTGLEDEVRRFWMKWKAERRSERKRKEKSAAPPRRSLRG